MTKGVAAPVVCSGGLAYLSACNGEGDSFEEQMRAALRALGAALDSVGAGFGDVVKTTVWLTEIADRPRVREIRREFFGNVKTAGTLVEVPRLAVPEALVAVDAIAGLPGNAERLEIKAPELAPQFSADAVRFGDLIFVTGCVSTDGAGNLVGEGDLAAQTRQTLENLRWSLAAAGAEMGDILKTIVYMVDVSERHLTYEIRAEYFGETPPASTMIEVSALGDPGYLIEIDAIAASGIS